MRFAASISALIRSRSTIRFTWGRGPRRRTRPAAGGESPEREGDEADEGNAERKDGTGQRPAREADDQRPERGDERRPENRGRGREEVRGQKDGDGRRGAAQA